jgi:hypothetical protein
MTSAVLPCSAVCGPRAAGSQLGCMHDRQFDDWVIDTTVALVPGAPSISSAREDESQKYFLVGTRSEHSTRRSLLTRGPGDLSHSMIDTIEERVRGTTYDPDRSVADFVMWICIRLRDAARHRAKSLGIP